jgi:hypothetical protein
MSNFYDPNPKHAIFTLSPFITLFSDAIIFCHLSENPALTRSARSSLARASILNSVFTLECAANVLLNGLGLPKEEYVRLERMPVLDKYESMLWMTRPNINFDRGRKEVQAVRELVRIRNAQVHVRTREQEVVAEYVDQFTWKFEAPEKSSRSIVGIPDNSDSWDHGHGQRALKALDDFLKLYLLEYAELSPFEVNVMLFSNISVDGKPTILIPEDCAEALELGQNQLELGLEYLDLDTPNVRVSIASKPFTDILKGSAQ